MRVERQKLAAPGLQLPLEPSEGPPQTVAGGAGGVSRGLKPLDLNMSRFGIVSCFMKKVFANEINSVNKIWGGRAARGERLFKHTSKNTLLQHLSHTGCMPNDGANYRRPPC